MKRKLMKKLAAALCFLTLSLGVVSTTQTQVQAKSTTVNTQSTVFHPMQDPPFW